jgi:hypothetical protein
VVANEIAMVLGQPVVLRRLTGSDVFHPFFPAKLP